MRVVFMGTPEFAATILKAIDEVGHEIVGVYTQPDKPKGRSQTLVASPVKEYAKSRGFAIYQPVRIKVQEEVERLKALPADIFIVAAFGQILSQEILDIPPLGCVNVHGSLLPKFRGAAPIQTALIQGEKETGVTIIYMAKGIDSGDMISSRTIAIDSRDNEESLYVKLAKIGGELLIETLPHIEDGTADRIAQDETLVTLAPQLKKEDGLLDFGRTATELTNQIRGMNVWPGAYTYIDGKLLKIWDADVIEGNKQGKPGSVYIANKDVCVCTQDALLRLLTVQLEGKKRMPATDFMRGYHLETGKQLGNTNEE